MILIILWDKDYFQFTSNLTVAFYYHANPRSAVFVLTNNVLIENRNYGTSSSIKIYLSRSLWNLVLLEWEIPLLINSTWLQRNWIEDFFIWIVSNYLSQYWLMKIALRGISLLFIFTIHFYYQFHDIKYFFFTKKDFQSKLMSVLSQ